MCIWYFIKGLLEISSLYFCNVPLSFTFKQFCELNEHPNIKFTSECEKNDCFSFLDVKIAFSNNQLVTSVFRMATFSCIFTNLKVFLHAICKFGLVYTLLCCSFYICSSYGKFHEAIVLLKNIFKKNEYIVCS